MTISKYSDCRIHKIAGDWKTLKMAFPTETVHCRYNSAALPRRL